MAQRIILRGPAQLARAHEVLNATPLREKKPLEMVIRPLKEDRTQELNAAYWIALRKAAQSLGYSPNELHDTLLANYFGKHEVTVGTTTLEFPNRRTTTNEDGERDVLEHEAMKAYFAWAEGFIAVDLAVSA